MVTLPDALLQLLQPTQKSKPSRELSASPRLNNFFTARDRLAILLRSRAARPAQNPSRQKQNPAQQIEHAVHRDPDNPERQ